MNDEFAAVLEYLRNAKHFGCDAVLGPAMVAALLDRIDAEPERFADAEPERFADAMVKAIDDGVVETRTRELCAAACVRVAAENEKGRDYALSDHDYITAGRYEAERRGAERCADAIRNTKGVTR